MDLLPTKGSRSRHKLMKSYCRSDRQAPAAAVRIKLVNAAILHRQREAAPALYKRSVEVTLEWSKAARRTCQLAKIDRTAIGLIEPNQISIIGNHRFIVSG